jgi:DNA-binding NtrC family response regulator
MEPLRRHLGSQDIGHLERRGLGASVLVLEPYDPAREALAALLRDAGHVVFQARGVTEMMALAVAEVPRLDFVITDSSFWDGHYDEAMAHLRERSPGLQRLLVSGLGAGPATVGEAGGVWRLPVELDALLARVSAARLGS